MNELNKNLVAIIVILIIIVGLVSKSNYERDLALKRIINEANAELSEYDTEYHLLNQTFYELYEKYVNLRNDYSLVNSDVVYWQNQAEYWKQQSECWEQQYWNKPYYQYNLTSLQRLLENIKNTKTSMVYAGNFYISLENLNASSGSLFLVMKAEHLYFFSSNKTIELELVRFDSGGYAFAFLGMIKGDYARISVVLENQTATTKIVLKNVLFDDGSFIKNLEYEQEG